jgi:hypothetical protein
LNIKPCMGHSHFKNMGATFMWILKKKYDYWWKKYGLEKTDWNFAFWQKLGDFIETKANKSPTSPGLVSPVTSQIFLTDCTKKGLASMVLSESRYAVKPVLRGHLWDKEKVVLKEVQFISNFLWQDKKNVTF